MNESKRGSVFCKNNGKCSYCNTILDPYGTFHIDHILPQSRGGGDELSNLALSCPSCNTRKGARTPEEANMSLILRFSWDEWVKLCYGPDKNGSRIRRRLHLLDTGDGA